LVQWSDWGRQRAMKLFGRVKRDGAARTPRLTCRTSTVCKAHCGSRTPPLHLSFARKTAKWE